ncbi:MAG: Re/Si-specific NAD(P)(+) transhydrogenase subunit alpha [Saprospiraceae bacterium]|nr:Re/Si-specific NAD(P)(+) transhydrogenase subunit alpha [Saprospiraceae bacterium]
MQLGILKEIDSEKRVAFLPEHINNLTQLGFDKISIESGAGSGVNVSDQQYQEAGATISDRSSILTGSDLVVGIHLPELASLGQDIVLVTQMNPLSNIETIKELKSKGSTVFSMDMVPRTTKAQAMDVLSSMATSAGYKAILSAAMQLPKFFPMFMTAAGTIAPAKVLILGAGVAGLQAISTARRLGAVVEAFDVRAAAKEEVMSLGAKFVEVEGAKDDTSAGGYAVEQTEAYKAKQAALIQEHAKKSDVIICTAQIPGRRAPLLVTEDTVKNMKPGAVVVDLAASTGGNCAFTEDDKTIVVHGVTIIGDSNLASTIPFDSSKMYGKNLINFFKELVNEEGVNFDFENEIIEHTCITYKGEIKSPRIKNIINQ